MSETWKAYDMIPAAHNNPLWPDQLETDPDLLTKMSEQSTDVSMLQSEVVELKTNESPLFRRIGDVEDRSD